MPYEVARPWARAAHSNHRMYIQWRIPRITDVLLRTPLEPVSSVDSYRAIYETM